MTCLVFGGAASHVTTEWGVYRTLSDKFQVKCIGGTSAGSLVALAHALGMTDQDFEDLCVEMMSGKMTQKLHFWNWQRRRWGRYSIRPLEEMIGSIAPKRFGDLPGTVGATFVPAMTKRPQFVYNTSHGRLPTAKVFAASCAIPFVFENVTIPGFGRCYDGGLGANVPADMFDDIAPGTPTITVKMSPEAPPVTPVETPVELAKSVADAVFYAINQAHLSDKKWQRTISLTPPGSGMDFELSRQQIRDRIFWGKLQTKKIFRQWKLT